MSLHDFARAVEKLEGVADRLAVIDRHLTDNVAAIRGLSLNQVLWSGSGTLDANGQARKEFTVPAASFSIENRGAHTMTVIVSDAPGDAPGPGPGVHVVVAGAFRRWNVTGRCVQILGTAGDPFDLEVKSHASDASD